MSDQTEVQRLRALLERLDSYIDFSEHLSPGDWGIEDVTGINSLFDEVREALSTTTEPTGPYTIRRYEGSGYNRKGQPFAVAIERDGYTVLQLEVGTERNEQEVENIVALLNSKPPEAHIIAEIKDLLESWDFRAIAAELESGYDRGVLVELCEKLTGAKSPRVNWLDQKDANAAKVERVREGDGNDA